jgi:hypothetical protein
MIEEKVVRRCIENCEKIVGQNSDYRRGWIDALKWVSEQGSKQ